MILMRKRTTWGLKVTAPIVLIAKNVVLPTAAVNGAPPAHVVVLDPGAVQAPPALRAQ